MTSLEFYDKSTKLAVIFFLLGMAFYLIYPLLSALTFGICSSIISFYWLAKDIKKYGPYGYRKGIIKRYGVLIGLFILSLKVELLGALLFILGYTIGQWYMVIKTWKK